MSIFHLATVILSVSLIGGSPGVAPNDISIQTIALSDTLAPGAGGALFRSFEAPVINALGQVLLKASVHGDPGSPWFADYGIWRWSACNLSCVARRGQPAPGADGRPFHYFNRMLLDDEGQIVFQAELVVDDNWPELQTRSGIWAGSPGDISLVARSSYGYGSQFRYLKGTASGGIVFKNDQGGYPALFAGKPGNLSLLAKEGEHLNGVGDYDLVEEIGNPTINPTGKVFFGTVLSNEEPYDYLKSAIWRWSGGFPEPIFIGNQQDLGQYICFIWSSVSSMWIPVPLSTSIASNIVFFDNDRIWGGKPFQLKLIAAEGQVAPGTRGQTFLWATSPEQDIFTMPFQLINARGDVAFKAQLRDYEASENITHGYWLSTDRRLIPVAVHGEHAPGTVNRRFRLDRRYDHGLSLNTSGKVLLKAQDADDPYAYDASKTTGIWIGKPNALRLIVHVGDQIEVAEGDFRTISYLDAMTGSGNEDGVADGFNDPGQVAFVAKFTDGSYGVFLASIRQFMQGPVWEDTCQVSNCQLLIGRLIGIAKKVSQMRQVTPAQCEEMNELVQAIMESGCTPILASTFFSNMDECARDDALESLNNALLECGIYVPFDFLCDPNLPAGVPGSCWMKRCFRR